VGTFTCPAHNSRCAAAAETEEEKERRNAELERLKEEARKRVEEEFAKQPKIIGTIDVRTGGFVVDPRTGNRRDIPSTGVPHATHAMEGAAH